VHTRLAGTVLLIMSTISPMTVLADPQEDHAEHPPVPYMPAEPIISDDVATVADQTGVDAVDLQGAVNTTGTDPTEYAYGTGLLKRPSAVAVSVPSSSAAGRGGGGGSGSAGGGYSATVRLTYYTLGGVTASGERVHYGGTACSTNWRMGTRFLVAGEVFVCNDRGILGSSGWLDLWNRRDIASKLGSYATVQVLP